LLIREKSFTLVPRLQFIISIDMALFFTLLLGKMLWNTPILIISTWNVCIFHPFVWKSFTHAKLHYIYR